MASTEPKVAATKSSIIGGQSLVIIWIALGTIGFYLINSLYAWLFLAFSAFSIYIIDRRFMCNSCYYCKSCTKGIAKLSLIFLGANRVPGLSKSTILGVTIFSYVVLTIVPGWVIASSLLQGFGLVNALLLGGLLGIAVVSIILHIIRGDKLITS